MGGENRREIVPRALSLSPPPTPPGESGVEREKGKRGEGVDHRLASG